MEKLELQRLNTLKNIFPEDSWSWAITALRRSPVIWNNLESVDFTQELIEDLGTDPEDWSPGKIGAAHLQKNLKGTINLPIASFDDLDADIKGKVQQTYQEYNEKQNDPPNLIQSVLLALALLGERDAGKSWAEIITQYAERVHWSGPLAILFSLIDNQADFLVALDPELALRVLLSNPIKPEGIAEILIDVLQALDLGELESWLKAIEKEVPDLVSMIARALLDSLDLKPDHVPEILALSLLNQLAGNQGKALQLLEKAAEKNHRIQGKVTANLNKVKTNLDEPQISDPAWQELKGSLSRQGEMSENLSEVAEIIHSLLIKNQFAAVADLVGKLPDPLPEHPGLLYVLAEFAHTQNQPIRAEGLAKQALELSTNAPPEGLSNLLLELRLYQESLQAADDYIKKYPNHLESHLDHIEALRGLGNYTEAAKAAQILTVLVPGDLQQQRKLAAYLEEAEAWNEALEVRASILTKGQSNPDNGKSTQTILPLNDLLAFANCAHTAGHYNRTVSACDQILSQEKENCLALGLKGKSLCALGKTGEGFAHLTRAVEISPEEEQAWLNLAESQVNAKTIDKALQTLQSGLTASQNRSRLYTLLGSIKSHQRNHSKALEIYKKAAAAAESEDLGRKRRIAIQLGMAKSYYELGHLDKARSVLQQINERFPTNHEANFLYGKVLLDLSEPRAALPYLVQAVDSQSQDPQAYLLYADALLQIGEQTVNATGALEKALELDPDNEIARVLLAEAQAAEGNYKKSILSFQRARESGLMIDPVWAPRISVGLGKTALKLGETETAIAALKDGQERFPADLNLIRHLAKAYQAASLIDNALDAARQAAKIAPQNPDNLSWIADFTLELGYPDEGISALKNLILVNPDQPLAFLQLGKAQAAAGNLKESAAAFSTLANFDEIQPDILLIAGDELIKLGELETGMESLSKAITICEANPEPSPLLPRIWSSQARGFEFLDDHQEALELLDQAIAIELNEPAWRIQKADLLIKGGRNQAAIASLNNALDLSPDEPALHEKMARVQRQTGASEEALYHAQQALSGYLSNPNDEPDVESALVLAADLASATLDYETAVEILESLTKEDINPGDNLSDEKIISLCLAGEIALDQAEEVKAADISNKLVSCQVEHPRVNTLQARILNRQGLLEEARDRYYDALGSWKKTPLDDRKFATGMEIALGKTALEIQCWDEASTHLQSAVDHSPKEKRALYELAFGYIILAETRRFYETFKVLNNTPGQIATSSDVHKNFQACLKALRDLQVEESLLNRLAARGKAVFVPSQESAEALGRIAETNHELAAVIAAYRHSRQKVFASQNALTAMDKLGAEPRLDAQIALSLLKIKPEEAFKAASSALESGKRSDQTQIPIYFVLLAQAAWGVDDLLSAEDAMAKALSIWDCEPRWYAQAADITADYARSVEYYKKAIELEPEYTGHYLALGKSHLNAKRTLSAVKCFEKALEVNPELIDGWIQRALAKRAQQRMPEAMASINQAMSLAPDHKEARKTAALLTFENGKYRESEKHLVTLLGQEPNDTELLALFARTLTAQKQSEQAMRVIDKAISIEENSLNLKLQRAGMIKHIEGPLAAVDELRIIGSHYSDQYPLVIELVTTLAEAGELDQAIRTALEILSNDEIGYTKVQKAHLYLTTGKLLRNNGQLDQAVHHLYKAKKLVEPNFEAILELGRVHFDRRQYDLALEKIQEAIQIEPDEAEGYYQAGRVLKELKEYNQAEKMLRKASKLAPNDLKIHRQLGVLVTLNLVHGESKQGVPV
jgi:tetratricopeptide (TPR) repeat protein